MPCSPANISSSGLEGGGGGGILTPSLGVSPSLASGSLDNLYLGEEAAGGPAEPTPNIGNGFNIIDEISEINIRF